PGGITRAPEACGGGGHAGGDLEVGTLVEDGAAPRLTPHETDAQRARLVEVDAAVEALAVAQRDGGRGPREEAQGRGPLVAEPRVEERVVERHVRAAVERLRPEQPEAGDH